MNSRENFVAYEYKNVTTSQNAAAMCIDCMYNFGWLPIEDDKYSLETILSNLNPVNLGRNISNVAQSIGGASDESMEIMLKFKRDRNIENKDVLIELEKEYEEALIEINKIERKNIAKSMGVSLGIGIIGTVFIGLAVYNFVFSNILFGVLFAVIGAVGWVIGFFSNQKISHKKSEEAEALIQDQFNIISFSCEKAHALLI